MTLFVTAAMLMATRAWGADAPLPYGHEIFKLYEAGDTEGARQALKEMVERDCALVRDHQPREPIDFITDLGISATAATLVHCINLEKKQGTLTEAWPTFRQMSEAILEASDTAIGRAASHDTAKANHQVVRSLASANQQKSRLIVACIRSLRDIARMQEAEALAERHSAFLRERGAPVDDLLGVRTPLVPRSTDAESVEKTFVLPGEGIAVVNAILRYWEALSREDVDALDEVLAPGEGLLSGEDVVRAVDVERTTKRSFDRIGRVEFDARSQMTIRQIDGTTFRVECLSTLKSFKLDGNTFQQRENDVFDVRLIDGKPRVILKGKGA